MTRSAQRALLPAAMAGAIAVLVAAASLPASAADPSQADIQWAQTVLKEKGLYRGRESGKLTEETRAALSAFQRKAGIKVTGRLDDPTIAKLEEGRDTSATVGNLAAEHSSGARRAQKPAASAEPRPQAAPTQRVEANGQESGPANLDISAGQSGPMPAAAPRTGVTPDPAADLGAGPGPTAAPPLVPGWVRAAVIAILGLTLAVAALIWWLSGRRPRRQTGFKAEAAAPQRREPTLGGNRRQDLRAEPPLRADRR